MNEIFRIRIVLSRYRYQSCLVEWFSNSNMMKKKDFFFQLTFKSMFSERNYSLIRVVLRTRDREIFQETN